MIVFNKKCGSQDETMSFGAAYRTYNVLLAEGRNIAAWCVFG
jgi:uncharacterized protein